MLAEAIRGKTFAIPCCFPASSLVDCESSVFMRVSCSIFFRGKILPAKFPAQGIQMNLVGDKIGGFDQHSHFSLASKFQNAIKPKPPEKRIESGQNSHSIFF